MLGVVFVRSTIGAMVLGAGQFPAAVMLQFEPGSAIRGATAPDKTYHRKDWISYGCPVTIQNSCRVDPVPVRVRLSKMQMLHRTTGAQTRSARSIHFQHACAAVQAVRITTNPRQHSSTADLVSFQPAGRVLAQLAVQNSCLRAPTACRAAPDANVAVQESLQGKPAHIPYCSSCVLPTCTLCCAALAPLHSKPSHTHSLLLCTVVADYICRGPLLASACITPQQVQQDLPTWQKLGQQLALQLGFDHDSMDDTQRYAAYSSTADVSHTAYFAFCFETTDGEKTSKRGGRAAIHLTAPWA